MKPHGIQQFGQLGRNPSAAERSSNQSQLKSSPEKRPFRIGAEPSAAPVSFGSTAVTRFPMEAFLARQPSSYLSSTQASSGLALEKGLAPLAPMDALTSKSMSWAKPDVEPTERSFEPPLPASGQTIAHYPYLREAQSPGALVLDSDRSSDEAFSRPSKRRRVGMSFSGTQVSRQAIEQQAQPTESGLDREIGDVAKSFEGAHFGFISPSESTDSSGHKDG